MTERAARKPRVEVHALTPDRWPDLERLFGPSGAYSGCWCMFLRVPSGEFSANGNAGNRRAFRAVVEAGPPGLLGYVDGEPAGWVAIAPREATPRAERSPITKPIDDEPAWAVTCFFIAPAHRGAGIGRALLDAAVAYARSHGARLLEAYPNDTAGRRVPAADAWRGTTEMFERAGFEVAARRKPARPIMRRRVRPSRATK